MDLWVIIVIAVIGLFLFMEIHNIYSKDENQGKAIKSDNKNKGEVIMSDNNFQIGLQNYNGLKTVTSILSALKVLIPFILVITAILLFGVGTQETDYYGEITPAGTAMIIQSLVLGFIAFLSWLYFAFMQEIILLFVQMAKSLNTIEVGISKDKK